MAAAAKKFRPDGSILDGVERSERHTHAGQTLIRAARIFLHIDGTQRAGAFAHFAFFSFFPAIILVVTVASLFFEREAATREIVGLIENYLPLDSNRENFIFETLGGVVESRAPASVFAIVLLCWAVARFFVTLIRATNRAWNVRSQNWWRLPLKSLIFLVAVILAIPLVIAAPFAFEFLGRWTGGESGLSPWIRDTAAVIGSMTLMFGVFMSFYMFAPRRRTHFSEVWFASIVAMLLMTLAQWAFSIYLARFASLNAVYGTFGGIMAFLVWIYLSGCIFIFGACLCAAADRTLEHPALKR